MSCFAKQNHASVFPKLRCGWYVFLDSCWNANQRQRKELLPDVCSGNAKPVREQAYQPNARVGNKEHTDERNLFGDDRQIEAKFLFSMTFCWLCFISFLHLASSREVSRGFWNILKHFETFAKHFAHLVTVLDFIVFCFFPGLSQAWGSKVFLCKHVSDLYCMLYPNTNIKKVSITGRRSARYRRSTCIQVHWHWRIVHSQLEERYYGDSWRWSRKL